MEGRGDRQKMLDTALQVCKFGTLLVLLFAIPLILEMETVLVLWLKNPPEYAGPLCQWMLVMLVIDRTTSGQMLAVNAFGKIALYELVQGTLLVLALPLAWWLFKIGEGPVALGYSLAFTMAVYCFGRLLFCKKLLKMGMSGWFRRVAIPVVLLVTCSTIAGIGIMRMVEPGFYRLCLVTAATGACSAGLGWTLLLNSTERAFVRELIKKMVARLSKSSKPIAK